MLTLTRQSRWLIALCGILGVPILLISFLINPGPPANSTIPQWIAFGVQYQNEIRIASWMQEAGSLLSIIFAIAVVFLAGMQNQIIGWLTLLGGMLLIFVSVLEVTFYLLTLQGGLDNNATTVSLGVALIAATQHAYSMIAAPAVYLPLGVIILSSRVLPAIYGYLALLIGSIFAILGIVVLFAPLQMVVNIFSGIQGLWFFAAGIGVLFLKIQAAKPQVSPA